MNEIMRKKVFREALNWHVIALSMASTEGASFGFDIPKASSFSSKAVRASRGKNWLRQARCIVE